MATNPGISIGFSRCNEGDLELKTKEIIAGLTGNPTFPDPEPPLPTVQNALAAYSEARVIAAAGSHAAVVAKDSSREALQKLLVQLGLWVMATAKGNADAWASSGFKLKKTPQPRQLPGTGVVTVSNGFSSGQLKAKIKAVNGAAGYQFEITDTEPGENTAWVSRICSTCSFTFTDLQPGKQYWIRVAATGARQQLQYSNIVNKFAQ